MIPLRSYQQDLSQAIDSAWDSGARNVLAVAPTGSGKTVLFSHKLHHHTGSAVVIAHRQELVSQISLSLAAFGVRHNIISQRSTVQYIASLHRSEFGAPFYDPAARIAVAGVDTLIRRTGIEAWAQQVSLWVCDEAAHLQRENKWGQMVAMFPNARGLGVTATPLRADGGGLGADTDGVFHSLVQGPHMRQLINEGYLSDYRVLCPESDLDLSGVPVSPLTGEYVQERLRTAARRSHLTGDIVEHYKRHAMGRRGVTFVCGVEEAHEVAAKFCAAGVPAAAVSAGTPDPERRTLVRQLRSGELLQLVNVDLFGEGFDLPAIEVCSMARPTKSYGLFVQQFGRALRRTDPPSVALIIDHVGNIGGPDGHGLPDAPRTWTLARRPRSTRGVRDPDIIQQRICKGCTQPYEAFYKVCPYCQTPDIPSRRDGPRYVDGDLVELTAETLARMRGEVARVDESAQALELRMHYAGGRGAPVQKAMENRRALQAAQGSLRTMLTLYGNLQRGRERPDSESYRRFYLRYGIDVLSAQALARDEAVTLTGRLIHDIGEGKI